MASCFISGFEENVANAFFKACINCASFNFNTSFLFTDSV